MIVFLYKNLTKVVAKRGKDATDSDAEMDGTVGRALKGQDY